MELGICIYISVLTGALIAVICVNFIQEKRIKRLKELEGRYFKVIDDYNQLERKYDLLKRENGWLEEERERLAKENDELEDRCIELSKSAVIEELFEGAKEKLDEYVQKIARKE